MILLTQHHHVVVFLYKIMRLCISGGFAYGICIYGFLEQTASN